MVNTKLVAHITVKTSEQRNMQFTCFNDALQSLANTTHTPQPLCDIHVPLDEHKNLILKSGPKEILADKSTQVIAQFFPLQSTPV